jgi:hypothetical protein
MAVSVFQENYSNVLLNLSPLISPTEFTTKRVISFEFLPVNLNTYRYRFCSNGGSYPDGRGHLADFKKMILISLRENIFKDFFAKRMIS